MSLTVHGKAVGGKFLPFNKDILSSWLAKHDGEFVSVKVGEKKRSNQQNAFYWSAIVSPISQHTGYTIDETHAILKELFLKRRDIVMGSATVEIPPESKKLTTEQFTKYVEDIMIWSVQELGLILEDPRR